MSDSNPCVPVAPSTNVKNTVSLAELLADIVMSGAVLETVPNDNCPLPSVFKNCPELPSAVGKINEKFVEIVVGALSCTLCELSAS